MIHCRSETLSTRVAPTPIALLHLAGLPLEDAKAELQSLYDEMLWNREIGEELSAGRPRCVRVILERRKDGRHPLEHKGNTLYPNFCVAIAWSVSNSAPSIGGSFSYQPPVDLYFVYPPKETALARVSSADEPKRSVVGQIADAFHLVRLDQALTRAERHDS